MSSVSSHVSTIPRRTGSLVAPRRRSFVSAGVRYCALLLVAAFFLRASSIPTGLSSQLEFVFCCGALLVTGVYLMTTYRPVISPVGFSFVILTLPSLLASTDPRAAALRWIGWALIVTVVGPLLADEVRLKAEVLRWVRRLLVVLTIGSLVTNFLGIQLAGRGVFYGLMGHSMLLAPVSALAAIDVFSWRKSKHGLVQIVLLVLCVATCVGAGSRGAVLGLGCGILSLVRRRRDAVIVAAAALIGLTAVSAIQLNRERRFQNSIGGAVYAELAHKGTNNTRSQLWSDRITEFSSSPVIGIGFQQQRIFRRASNGEYIEPGSSYLAVLSMTGIVGAVGFVWMVMALFSSVFSSSSAVPSTVRPMLRGWVVFFAVHFVAEGYIFACGSLICFLFWLTAGCAMTFHHQGLQARRRARMRFKQQVAQASA